MENYLVSINGVGIICTTIQKKFVEQYLSEYCCLNRCDNRGDRVRLATRSDLEICLSFEFLNKPTTTATNLELPIASYFGCSMTNEQADASSLDDFGYHFSVLCWVDGCEDAFRTTPEE